MRLKDDKDWAGISATNLAKFKKLGERMNRDYGNKFQLRVAVFKSLPQWHGWLIADKRLYLGRVRFEFTENDRPSMQVGENEYRFFYRTESGKSQGDTRIDLFKNWLNWYGFDNSEVYPDVSTSCNTRIYWDLPTN